MAGAGDFLYGDPPYAPLSRAANFTSYTASRFDGADSVRLQQLVVDAGRGCHVLLSHSTAAEIAALYETSDAARSAGRSTNSSLRTSPNCRMAGLQEGRAESEKH